MEGYRVSVIPYRNPLEEGSNVINIKQTQKSAKDTYVKLVSVSMFLFLYISVFAHLRFGVL